MKNKLFMVLMLLALIGCGIETYTEIEEPSLLVGEFYSYKTLAGTIGLVEKKGYQFRVEEGTQSGNAKRPPYKIDAITIENYSVNGYVGTLNISFFNDRLMSCWFYPKDYDSMISSLKTTIGIVEESEDLISKYTRIRTYKDYKGYKYIDWEDVRLSEQHGKWIAKYS